MELEQRSWVKKFRQPRLQHPKELYHIWVQYSHRGLRVSQIHNQAVEGDTIGINLEGEDEATAYLPFAWITEAKLILTDQLLKRGADERAARMAESDQASEDEDEE